MIKKTVIDVIQLKNEKMSIDLIQKKGNSRYECTEMCKNKTLCKYSTFRKTDFHKHLNEVHSNSKRFSCDFDRCNYGSNRGDVLLRKNGAEDGAKNGAENGDR